MWQRKLSLRLEFLNDDFRLRRYSPLHGQHRVNPTRLSVGPAIFNAGSAL